ncbi:TonB-dependent receptor [bacterium]|nr:TonB-dependent receptor [bacterium]
MKHQNSKAHPRKTSRGVFGSRGFRLPVFAVAAIGFLFLFPFAAVAEDFDITELSIEELMDIEVTSVSKKAEKLSEAAAAIYVITADDIRRSGFTCIPEALRMVPGLQVARIDLNTWAISARGFNGQFASKLLVLIDGRSVYSPLFSGVFWELQDVLLADVERIEVIRGPGATLWGANAVNGVINIITKNASDTQGALTAASSGTREHFSGQIRYGGALSKRANYRLYGKSFSRYQPNEVTGTTTGEEWEDIRSGFRVDLDLSRCNSLTVQGNIYKGAAGTKVTSLSSIPPYTQIVADNGNAFGANALTRLRHSFSAISDMTLQIYFDRTEHDKLINQEKRSSFDVDYHQRWKMIRWNEVIWGLRYRYTQDRNESTFEIAFDPEVRKDDLFSAFIQDEITIRKDRLKLIAGSKFENNDYTGFEFQPNVRFLWTPHHRHTFWSAVSRAVRTPSRAEHNAQMAFMVIPPGDPTNPYPLPMVPTVVGNEDFESEVLKAFEIGYRVRPKEMLSLSVDLFYNDYDNLRWSETGLPYQPSPTSSYIIFPLYMDNSMFGESYGIEVATDWRPRHWWRLQLAYTLTEMDLIDTLDAVTPFTEEIYPPNQVFLKSSVNVSRTIEFDANVRYVDRLRNMDVSDYFTVDLRTAWKPLYGLEVFIVGQNLVAKHHAEFSPSINLQTLPSEVERTVYVGTTWNF